MPQVQGWRLRLPQPLRRLGGYFRFRLDTRRRWRLRLVVRGRSRLRLRVDACRFCPRRSRRATVFSTPEASDTQRRPLLVRLQNGIVEIDLGRRESSSSGRCSRRFSAISATLRGGARLEHVPPVDGDLVLPADHLGRTGDADPPARLRQLEVWSGEGEVLALDPLEGPGSQHVQIADRGAVRYVPRGARQESREAFSGSALLEGTRVPQCIPHPARRHRSSHPGSARRTTCGLFRRRG